MSRTKPATPKPIGPNLASIEVAATRYGVSEKTMRRMISSGHINAYRVGAKLIRIDLDEADAVLLRPIPTAGTFGAA